VSIGKADSLTVYDNGKGMAMGTIHMTTHATYGINIDGVIVIGSPISINDPDTTMSPLGPNRVVIWRSFGPREAAAMNEKGVLVGLAYLKWDDGAYYFIRKVDLTHSDVELAREFGIESKK
jgi:hypothetical protein